MKIAILTTDTSHHNFIVRELSRTYPIALVLDEKRTLKAPFETAHSYEALRDEYEWERFFSGKRILLPELAPTIQVENVNNQESIKALRDLSPDVVIDIGTGKVSQEVIQICPDGIINLHGGNPEEYRGLDTILWAIYHGDYSNVVVTLHRLNAELDRGDILATQAIPLMPRMKLFQLRAENVVVCMQLLENALATFSAQGLFVAKPQRKIGRYYSFMPSVLKELCRNKFEKYTERLSAPNP